MSDQSPFPLSVAREKPSIVVGIGSSAGALDGYEAFFAALPLGSGMAVVVVAHLDPKQESPLPEILRRTSLLPVVEVADGLELYADHVYVVQPGAFPSILNGTLLLTTLPDGMRPIDAFLTALAEDQREHAAAVILSGAGSDGALGVEAVKSRGGLVLVQQPETAQYPSMPQAAQATGLADYVMPPEELAATLYAHLTHTTEIGWPDAGALSVQTGTILQKLLLLIRNRTGHDFSLYKRSTLLRRIDRRMKSRQIQKLSDYLDLVQETPNEVELLFNDLLINVTSFFRDPGAYEVLTDQLRLYLATNPELQRLRVWVPGCSTGEEAYSVAILLCEVAHEVRRERYLQIQIFATDIDEQAIDLARQGFYSSQGVAGVSPERLERHFTPVEGGYQVRSELRDLIVFAKHNTFSDPPFTRLDLITCRNMLIYFSLELQKQVLAIFHYALNHGGLLLLGLSETAGTQDEQFETLDARWKLYRRDGHEARLPISLLTTNALPMEFPVQSPGRKLVRSLSVPLTRSSPILSHLQQLLLRDWTPPAALVDEAGNVISISGRTSPYLELGEGAPHPHVLTLAVPALRYHLSSALSEAIHSKQQVTLPEVAIPLDEGSRHVVVVIRPIHLLESPGLQADAQYLIVFNEIKPSTQLMSTPVRADLSDHAAQLARELASTQDYLEATIEEMEVTLEERKSTNEELQTANEELQSSNEELMTSKEELQSLNEELITINAEHQAIIQELQEANDDTKNLLDSIGVATLFLDNSLRIKRFTPKITQLINLMPVDVGRPITDIAFKLRGDPIFPLIDQVLESLQSLETEVQTLNEQWYLMRISPYRTSDNFIDGVVVVFTNIASIKQLENDLRISTLYSSAVLETMHDPVVVLDHHLRIVRCNTALFRLFRVPLPDLSGDSLFDIGDGELNQPELYERLREVVTGGEPITGFLQEINFSWGKRVLKLNARRLISDDDLAELVLLWGEDITPTLEQLAQEGTDAVAKDLKQSE